MGANSQRKLYLVAYDVMDSKRLRQVRKCLIGYKVGGQKSVFEMWITPTELIHIQRDLTNIMDTETDRLNIFALDARMEMKIFGKAQSFDQTYFSIV